MKVTTGKGHEDVIGILGELQQMLSEFKKHSVAEEVEAETSDEDEDTTEENEESSEPKHIDVKGDGDILSMMYKRQVPFMYGCRQHTYGETAYQMSKAEDTLSGQKRNDFLEEMYPMNGFDAKEHAKKLKYNQAWQSIKREEVKNIARKIFENDPRAKQALKDTGNKEIRHTVSDTYWGTGGVNNDNGDNEYEQILMELREEFFGPEFTVKIRKDTKVIFLTDSQGKHVRSKDFFGKDRVMIRKTPTVESLAEFARNAPVNRPNVEKIVLGVGINNAENGTPDIEESIKASMDILAMKFPNATIAYTEALYKGTNPRVTELNQNMKRICEERHYKFARQSMAEKFFTDAKHINAVGTKILVSNIYRAFNLPMKSNKPRNNREEGQGYRQNQYSSKRYQGHGNGYGSQAGYHDQQIPVHISGRQGHHPMFSFPPSMHGPGYHNGYYSGQGPYNQSGPYHNQHGYNYN